MPDWAAGPGHVAPGSTCQRYYWLCNQSLCAPVASPMRWLAPVLAHPCSPSLSSCLSRRDTPSPASTTQKSIWDLGSPSSFAFCNPSGNFFLLLGAREKNKPKRRGERELYPPFLLSALHICVLYSYTANFYTSSFPRGLQ